MSRGEGPAAQGGEMGPDELFQRAVIARRY
jgi:hypothetical protein